MKQVLRAAPLVAATVLFAALLLRVPLLEGINNALDWIFGAPPRWTQVSRLPKDPRLHEVSGGDHPSGSLSQLAAMWRSSSGPRIIFIGNSQMQAMSLASGENPSGDRADQTYFDLIADSFSRRHSAARFYRLSAPGMNYQEALWYLEYLAAHPELKPEGLVMQINYQAFWLSGIRDGMLELLEDPQFRARIEARVAQGAAYTPIFEEALKTYERRLRQKGETQASVAQPPGLHLETAVRKVLSATSLPSNRARQKEELFNLLYRIRLYIFNLKPSTARSITGVRLERSRAAMEALMALCQEKNIDVLLFSAPLNPSVQLYRTDEDRTAYAAFLDGLEQRYGIQVLRLDNLIPAAEWGRWFNGPDPLHLSRAGHRRVAERLTQALTEKVEGL